MSKGLISPHIDRDFGKYLKKKRLKKKMTQKEIADPLRYTAQYVHNWEHGKASVPIDAIPIIAKVLDISIDEIIKKLLQLYKKRLKRVLFGEN